MDLADGGDTLTRVGWSKCRQRRSREEATSPKTPSGKINFGPRGKFEALDRETKQYQDDRMG